MDRPDVFPKGGRVYGHIRRLLRYDEYGRAPVLIKPGTVRFPEHGGEVLIGLEFEELAFGRRRTPFAARLIAVEPETGRRGRLVRNFGYFGDAARVQYDAPGTASLYLAAKRSVLPRGFTMRWLTVEPR